MTVPWDSHDQPAVIASPNYGMCMNTRSLTMRSSRTEQSASGNLHKTFIGLLEPMPCHDHREASPGYSLANLSDSRFDLYRKSLGEPDFACSCFFGQQG